MTRHSPAPPWPTHVLLLAACALLPACAAPSSRPAGHLAAPAPTMTARAASPAPANNEAMGGVAATTPPAAPGEPYAVRQVGHFAPQAPCPGCGVTHGAGQPHGAGYPSELPPVAWTGEPIDDGHPWAPPALRRPWPRDEYLCDGGDRQAEVVVRPDWSVDGLDLEDTVAHFDTLEGGTIVEPSNPVCIYAPRFAAVRQVSSTVQHRRSRAADHVDLSLPTAEEADARLADMATQQRQPFGQVGVRAPVGYVERQALVHVQTTLRARRLLDNLAPFEDLQYIRGGQLIAADKPMLAEGVAAALAWSESQAAQVVIDEVEAIVASSAATAQETVQYELGGKPSLCLVKLASRKEALPGDVIDFTLRFDNNGTQTIGNVTIIDNLVTRLEYVPDSAQSTLDADFLVTDNEGESLTLRWEIRDPLPPGEGGVIRFRCLVR